MLVALSVLSLLLCVATIVLWVRSYECTDHIRREGWEVQSGQGSLVLSWSSCWGGAPLYWADEPDAVSLSLQYGTFHSVSRQRDVRFAGVGYARYFTGTLPVEHVLFFMPHWLPGAILLMPSALLLLPVCRRQCVNAKSTCKTCGYDLRATPDRCPECGRASGLDSAAPPETIP
jgi:hypothetical protein